MGGVLSRRVEWTQRGYTGWGAVSKSGMDTQGLDRVGCCLEEWNGHTGVRQGGVLSRRVEWTQRGRMLF